jgi:peptide/nickel transport system permease protein
MPAMNDQRTDVKEKKRSQLGEVWRRLRRNKAAVLGMSVIVMLFVVAIFAPLLAPYDPNKIDMKVRLQASSPEHLLGTDNFGRDILSRIIYGSRISLYVGFVAVGIGAVFGGILGAIGGFYGKQIDNVIMRLMDVLLAVPQIILAIAIVGVLGTSLTNLMIAVGISQVPRYARLVRASAMSLRGQEFVEAAKAIGATDLRIILENILPNCMAPIIVQSTLGVGGGHSVGRLPELPRPRRPASDARVGSMLSAGRQFLRSAPHLSIYPGTGDRHRGAGAQRVRRRVAGLPRPQTAPVERDGTAMNTPLLQVKNLNVVYRTFEGVLHAVNASTSTSGPGRRSASWGRAAPERRRPRSPSCVSCRSLRARSSAGRSSSRERTSCRFRSAR